ncbi:MAG: zinc-dependent metalloprotease [Gemmataceae bacterium]|nr:zinc-dependent metalloprotease [Gemmataceae bacterium]
MYGNKFRWLLGVTALLGMGLVASAQQPLPGGPLPGGPGTAKPLPPKGPPMTPQDVEKLIAGFEKVVSTMDGRNMFGLYVDRKYGQALIEVPREALMKKYFVALTVAGGEIFAGLQEGDIYLQWKQYGDRLALIEPTLDVRSTGDQESKSSVQRLFTGRVIADLPILVINPKNAAFFLDLDELLLGNLPKFFGGGMSPMAMRLREIKSAKAFPQNLEISFEIPTGFDGRLKTFHFSISEIPENTGYQPRNADERVGYFTTAFNDLGKFKAGEKRTRHINRWHLEKADPALNMSPPKQPIIFYVEHTTPIRYRRFVRDGVLYWNQAFEKVGLVNAIEVYFQDARTGAHMEKDPEDVRYNFIRWLNNDISTAIGPSRVHPLTGQILDADIILTDGWIRHFEKQFSEVLPQLAMEGFGPETMAWLERNPQWDPRFLLAPAHSRNTLLAQRLKQGPQPLGGHPFGQPAGKLMGVNEYDGLVGRMSQVNGMCMAASGKAMDLTLLRMTYDLMQSELEAQTPAGDKDDPKKPKPKPKSDGDELDGIPSKFIGPLLADLVAHEVGHTLGLRHNFKASALYSLADINSNKVKGKKPFAGSVMDYLPINIDMKDGEFQGDYAMITIGPYDMWAIEYGYSFEKDLKPILAKCVEPEHQFATDQDTVGPDPLARRYDFAANPLDYAKNQMKLAKHHRDRLINKFVKDGESWSKARFGYELTLMLQTRSLSMMSGWVGGAFVRRDHKGDKGNRPPIEAVPAAQQREALKWVIENAFRDEAFGLTTEMLQRMRSDFLATDESFQRFEEAGYPIHDRVMGIQKSVLTMLMNPTTLRRVYDSEFLVERDKDAVTMPEMLDTVGAAIWTEIDKLPQGKFTARQPLITSLRRNLQREMVNRLIDLAHNGSGSGAASKPIANLAAQQLRQLSAKIDKALKADQTQVDPYTKAHLVDAHGRIAKALEAQYILNVGGLGGGFGFPSIFFEEGRPQTQQACHQPGCRQCGWDSRRE